VTHVKDLILVLPRLARMIASLMTERRVSATAKIALAAMALYLASPIDVLPDFIPFVGWIDDLLLVALVVDGLLTYVDRSILLKYWPGSPESLDAVAAVARRVARFVPRRVEGRIFGQPGRAA
jgi:uncharacterized membrane protein YkvA (DUF1232 family)